MVFFFLFLFPPPLQPAHKSLALLPFFFSPHCLLTLSLMNTLTFCLQQSFSLTLPGAVRPPLPSLTPRLPPLLPGQFLSSGRRQSAGVFRLLLHQRAGLKRSAWERSLSLPLSPWLVSSHGDEGAALWAVEEVRGNPGSTHSAAVCLFGVVYLHPRLSLSLSLSLRVAFSSHLSSPLSLIPLSACFSYTLSQALSFYFLSLLVLFFLSHRFSFSLSPSQSRDKVR